MDDELVLFTSYFNLAGGRRQDTADTFRVDPSLSSATSPDGSAALYVVTEASTGGHMGPRARRRAADVVAWEYASHGEEPPAARLRAALRAAHEAVRDEFDGHVAVGMSIIAVERDTVYLGQVAPAQVYVLHDGSLHSIPANVEGNSPFAGALGATGGPHVSVFRDQIGPDDVVTLCNSWFHRGVDADELRDCFGAATGDDIAESMLELAKQYSVRDATVIVIEATPASELQRPPRDEEELPSLLEQVDTAVQALASAGKMLWSEFRTPLTSVQNGHHRPARQGTAVIPEIDEAARDTGTSTATERPPEAELPRAVDWEPEGYRSPKVPEQPGQDVLGATRVREQATEEVPLVAPITEPAEPSTTNGLRGEDVAEPAPPAPSRRRSKAKPAARAEPITELDQVNSRIQSAPDLGNVIPPVQAFPDTSTEPERIYATTKDIQAVNKRPRRFGAARDVSSGPAVIRPSLNDVDLRRPPSRPAPPALIWFSAVVFLALVGVAMYKILHRPHYVALNPYPAYVKKDLRLAASAKRASTQDYYLTKARKNLALAQANGTLPKKARQLRQQILITSDTLHHITREYAPLLLSNFGQFPSAQATQIAVAPGLVFVLDTGRHDVFSVTPNSTSNPALLVQAGENDSGFVIGLPQHITTDGSTLLVLDDHNVLVRDVTGVKTATSLTDPVQTPQKVAAIGTLDPDAYLLDNANSQLWRYPGAVSGYSPQAAGYFDANTPHTPNLSHAVSFAFNQSDLFILQPSAAAPVLEYDLQANPVHFTVNLHTSLQHATQLYTAPGLHYVWIADPSNGRIVQLDPSGRYIRTYRSGSANMDLRQILSLAVGPAGNTIYVLCGPPDKARLFAFPIVK